MYDMTKKKKGFTIIELMVSIFVTLIVLGTFFKLYTNFMKSERNTNIRTSVAHIGDQIAENLVAPISLIGLNNNYVDFSAIPSPIFKKTDGGSGSDGVDFQFYSQ